MITRAIYSHYSKPMKQAEGAIGWHSEKYFWIGLALSVAAVLAYFLFAYHGRGAGPAPGRTGENPRS